MLKFGRIILSLCLYLLCTTQFYAQENYAEKYNSLKNTACIETSCTDSLFLWLYFQSLDNLPLADSLSNDFLQFANTQDNDYLKAKANMMKTVIYNNQGKSIDAISSALVAIRYFGDVQSIDVCFTYQNLSTAYNKAGNYKLARENNKKALKIAKTLNNQVLIVNSYNDIGIGYNYDKQYKEAIPWFKKVIENSKNDLKTKAQGYVNLGLCYRYLGDYDQALLYAQKSLATAEQDNYRYNIAYALNDMGATYLLKKEYDSAIMYLNQSAQMREDDKEGFELAYTYQYLGDCYTGKNEKQKALNYYRKAITINKENNNLKQRYGIYHQLGEMFYHFRELDSAYIYEKKYAELRDSVVQTQIELSAAAMVASYELGEKDKNIQLLEQQNELNQLGINIRNKMLVMVAIGFLLLAFFSLWLDNRNRLKKKQHELILLQNLQDDKERIARDLHDNIGGQLSYIIYSLDGINDEEKGKRLEITESINHSVRSVISSLRETIWAISDANVNIQDFSDKLKVFARNLFKHNRTHIDYTENILVKRELNALLGLNLYRICQEILNNAFKYASADTIQIIVTCDEDEKIFITIKDDGIGFDCTQENGDRYGLQNIKKRATEFGITLTLETKLHQGTKYTLIV